MRERNQLRPVGYVGSDLADAGLQEHWNGKTWSVVFGMAKNTDTPPVDMTGVSCVGAKFCIAVGSVTKRWNGKTWSKIASAGGGSVSCVSTTYCLAVGGPSASQWNGKTWSPITGPNPDGRLAGVSCSNATTCVAVGSYNTSLSTNTLVEQTS